MDAALFFKALFRHKVLLILGILVSVGVAVFTGYSVGKDGLTLRASQDYSAATTVMVSSPAQSIYAADMPPRALVEGQTPGAARDLSETAVLYAYTIGSDEMRALLEAQMGPLASYEQLTAIQRTTQPDGNERFPGDFDLPIIDVIGTSHSAARAEQISEIGSEVFKAYAAQQQELALLPATDRVGFATLNSTEAEVLEGSSPLLPIIAVGLGVFLAFVALILVVDNISRGRARAKARRSEHELADTFDDSHPDDFPESMPASRDHALTH